MSMDRTLKTSGGIIKQRSVLTRPERIAILQAEGRFDPESDKPVGLPKVRVKTSKAGTKSKKDSAESEEAAG
jgi:small basic protein (TIGR04137 family)